MTAPMHEKAPEIAEKHESIKKPFRFDNFEEWEYKKLQKNPTERRILKGHYYEEVIETLLQHHGWKAKQVEDDKDWGGYDIDIEMAGKEKVDVKGIPGNKWYVKLDKEKHGEKIIELGIPGETIIKSALGSKDAQDEILQGFEELKNHLLEQTTA